METFRSDSSDTGASVGPLAAQIPATEEETAAAFAAIATYLEVKPDVESRDMGPWTLAGRLEAHGDSNRAMSHRFGWKR